MPVWHAPSFALALSDCVYNAIIHTFRDPHLYLIVYTIGFILIPVVLLATVKLCGRFYKWLSPEQYAAALDRLYPGETILHPVTVSKKPEWWPFAPTPTGAVVEQQDAKELRKLFTADSFRLGDAFYAADNVHGRAAQRRMAAVNMCAAIAKRHGLHHFDESKSRRNCKHDVDGTRTVMSAKDACSYLTEHLTYRPPPAGSFVSHIDTFTLKDLTDAHNTLSDGNIHFIYTWNPTKVAGTSDELNFRFDEKGNLITSGAGFKPYVDTLTDFENDHVVTTTHGWHWSRTTLASLFMIMLFILFNVLQDYQHNSNLINFGFFWAKSHQYRSYLGWLSYDVYEQSQGLTHFLVDFGIPPGWTSVFDGAYYLTYSLTSHDLTYLWPAETVGFTAAHWICILALLFSALFNSRRTIVYCHQVVRIDVGEHRTIVIIIPNARYTGFAAHVRPFLQDAALKHRKPHIFETGAGYKFVAERRQTPCGHSVAFVNSLDSHFIADPVADIAKALSTNKSDPSLANIKISSKADGEEVDRVAAALSIALNRLERPLPAFSGNYGYGPVPTIVRQDTEASANGEEIKDVMAKTTMPAIVSNGAFVHAKSHAQNEDLVNRRLRQPAKKVEAQITTEIADLIHQFAKFVRMDVLGRDSEGFLELITEEQYEESRKTGQLAKFLGVKDTYDIDSLDDVWRDRLAARKGFNKREVLADPSKAARGICTFPPQSQALGGRIALAYAQALKACQWVACGLTPQEIVLAVVKTCVGAESITETDFSAQDATIEEQKRAIELMLLKNLFHPDRKSVV